MTVCLVFKYLRLERNRIVEGNWNRDKGKIFEDNRFFLKDDCYGSRKFRRIDKQW